MKSQSNDFDDMNMNLEPSENEEQESPQGLELIAEDGNFKSERRKKSRRGRALIIALIAFFSLILALLAAFLILYQVGKKQLLDFSETQIEISPEIKEDNGVADESDGKIIKYKGETYRLNEDITTILCMGIDRGENNSQGYGANGQADANFLLNIDTKTGKTTAISISRDTMVDANVYSDEGAFSGAKLQQLCLAFANGDGGKQSCENMKKSVSSIFYGLPINSYIAIDLNAIGVLNELVGGVDVTSPETFFRSEYYFEKGKQYHLSSQSMAETFVRYRDVNVLDSNQSRIERQKIYLKGFSAAAISKTRDNLTFPIKLYNSIKDYNINDMNAAKITFLTSAVIKGRENIGVEFLSVEGEVKQGETYAEFYPDGEKLFELILKVYYEKV